MYSHTSGKHLKGQFSGVYGSLNMHSHDPVFPHLVMHQAAAYVYEEALH